MVHTITVTDDQYARLQAAAQTTAMTLDAVLADLINGLPAAKRLVSSEEYAQRWEMFWDVVGSIQQGQPLTSEEMEELIGEEVANDHAGASA